MFILNCNKRKLKNTDSNKSYKLSLNEIDLLLCLSNNNTCTFKDCCLFIYRYYDKSLLKNIRTIKSNLDIKTNFKLNIESRYGIGYIMKTEVYIE